MAFLEQTVDIFGFQPELFRLGNPVAAEFCIFPLQLDLADLASAWLPGPKGMVLGLRTNPTARKLATALSAHERAHTIPTLHNTNTAAWGRLKEGKWVVTTAVH
jgi:hypothetical protein